MRLDTIIKHITGDGITRNVDELGRIGIPMGYRKAHFKENFIIYMYPYKDYIIVSKINQNNEGIEKRLDKYGRFVPPKELRTKLNWNESDSIETWNFKDYIIFKKEEKQCTFCRSKRHLIEFNGKMICSKCQNELIKV